MRQPEYRNQQFEYWWSWYTSQWVDHPDDPSGDYSQCCTAAHPMKSNGSANFSQPLASGIPDFPEGTSCLASGRKSTNASLINDASCGGIQVRQEQTITGDSLRSVQIFLTAITSNTERYSEERWKRQRLLHKLGQIGLDPSGNPIPVTPCETI